MWSVVGCVMQCRTCVRTSRDLFHYSNNPVISVIVNCAEHVTFTACIRLHV